MEKDNKALNQENAGKTPDTTTKNTTNSQSFSGQNPVGQSSSQPTASAAAKGFEKSGTTSTGAVSAGSTKSEDLQSAGSGAIKNFYDKAKESAGQVTEKATDKLDEKKATLTQGLSGVADSIRQVGENLRETSDKENPIGQYTAQYGETIARQVETISNYFDRKDVREIARDVESFARRNPAVFIGGAFALGMLAARFLKSSSPKHLTKKQGRSLGTGYSYNEGTGSEKTSRRESSNLTSNPS